MVPNPATDHFTVKSSEPVQRVEIANMIGQVVYSQNGGDEVSVSLPAGTYFVQIYTANSKSVEKLQVK